MKSYLYLFLSIVLFTSCIDSENEVIQPEPQTEVDILKYIEDNNLDATKTESGLYYVINSQGEGTQPTSGSDVTVSYKGTFLNGVTFDKSTEAGIEFNLSQVISGWTEGIQLFKEGGEGLLIVPYNLGYGINNNRGIPGGSVLVFDINLISVNN
ncbi:FKBP-type peptidyl-prolyl cis-trans isomerase [Polaribacter sp. 11A2H]|uniref:FKBP-type peptidyl-prolyl cis-trans isomerase n=1 Tax=Polaribacter sp. 11A2H TaxID=2687290 RepID=UPI00140B21B9|nr:FKBP-type peptidyl-prolyl cis-trans isomerase [Polaribacter sp. 11A2H]